VVSIDQLNIRSLLISVVLMTTKIERFFPAFEVMINETGKPEITVSNDHGSLIKLNFRD